MNGRKDVFSRRFHKYLGLVMLLPLLGWAFTGSIFLVKPGYEGAYETLQLQTYPMGDEIIIPAGGPWDEVTLVRSILGEHLLVKRGNRFANLEPGTLRPAPVPDQDQLARLFNDTMSRNPKRYGAIRHIEGTTAYTDTGITISLDWDTLTFAQRGNDRAVIDLLYKVHYLQWTPWPAVNEVFGVLGLLLLLTLSLLGLRIYLKNTE